MQISLNRALQGLGILAAAIASVATSRPRVPALSKSVSDDLHSVELTQAAPIRTLKVRVHVERTNKPNDYLRLSLHAATRGVVIRSGALLAGEVCVQYKLEEPAASNPPSYACIARGKEHPNVAIAARALTKTKTEFTRPNAVEFGAEVTTNRFDAIPVPGVCYSSDKSGQLVAGTCSDDGLSIGEKCEATAGCDLDVELQFALINPELGADSVPLTLAAVAETGGTLAELSDITFTDLP